MGGPFSSHTDESWSDGWTERHTSRHGGGLDQITFIIIMPLICAIKMQVLRPFSIFALTGRAQTDPTDTDVGWYRCR